MLKTVTYCFLLFSIHTAYGQQKLQIDADLAANSQPLEVKRKGASAIGKYQFGAYKIVSGKAGLTTSKSKQKLFSAESEAHSKRAFSFVFVRNDSDSVLVNAIVTSKRHDVNLDYFSLRFNWDDQKVSETNDYFMVNITRPGDSIEWKMTTASTSKMKTMGDIQYYETTTFKGGVTNGLSDIEIKDVPIVYKSVFQAPVYGYQFFQGDKAIGAVQLGANNRLFVWLHKDLDAKAQLSLAAAMASMMVKQF